MVDIKKVSEISDKLAESFDIFNKISNLKISESTKDQNKVSMDISKSKKYFDLQKKKASDGNKRVVTLDEILTKAIVSVGQRIPNIFIFSSEGKDCPSDVRGIFSFVNSSEEKKNEFEEEMEIPIEIFEMVFNEKLLPESLANTIIEKLKIGRERKMEMRDQILESDDLDSIKNFLGISI